MRKLFRMAYESCTGQCYAYSDVMKIHTLGLDAKGAAEFIKRLLAMHAPSCGNTNIQFRLDADEWTERTKIVVNGKPLVIERTRFIASFYRYGSLDLYSAESPLEAMNAMIDGALAWYQTDDGKRLIKRDSPAVRAGVCHHGTDDKLINFAIEFSGLDAAGRDALREQFGYVKVTGQPCGV